MRTIAVLASVALMMPGPAWADSVTHDLRLLAQDRQTDCIRGRCVPACVLTAKLTNLGRASPSIDVALLYRPKARSEPEAQMSFSFPALGTQKSATTVDDAPSTCRRLTISKVEVTCPEARDRCPGFFYVQVPQLAAPQLRRQKVEGR